MNKDKTKALVNEVLGMFIAENMNFVEARHFCNDLENEVVKIQSNSYFQTKLSDVSYVTAKTQSDPVQKMQEAKPAPRGRKPRTEHSAEMLLNTQPDGKLKRINMAFDNDIYEYIHIMARVIGLSMTDFVNIALRQHMKDHGEVYQNAIEFRNNL